MKKIDRYFERCIIDAYKSENREYKPEDINWFYVIVDNQILFSVNTPYTRVSRKIECRIRHNINKNFGFDIDGDYFIDDILQPNLVCNHFVVGNNLLYLCEKLDFDNMEIGVIIGSGRYEKLCKAYYGVSTEEFRERHDELHLPSDISWSDYRKVYFKAYGRYPEVLIQDKSETVILK